MTGPSHALRVETRQIEGVSVVVVRGEVNLGSAPQFRELLVEAALRTTGDLRVDLSGVTYMDSSGVGTLVYVKRECERADRRLVLIAPQPRVRSVFEITHLDEFFTIARDLQEARRT